MNIPARRVPFLLEGRIGYVMASLSCLAVLVTAAVVFADVDAKKSDAWPFFRGNPQQTGVATTMLPEQLEILWKIKPSESQDASFEGTAAIVQGVAYLGSMDSALYAFDLATGQIKWAYKTDKSKNQKVGPIKTPVSVHDGLLFVGDTDGVFHCVEAPTGKKLWSFDTESEVSSGASFAGDSVLFGSSDETMYCLSLQGKERWRFKVPGGPVLGTPAIAGDRTFAAGCDSSLHVIDLKTGKEVGNTVPLDGQVGASVAVMGDQLYIGTMSGQVLAINWKKGERVWEFAADAHPQAFFASAAVSDQFVVSGSRDRHVYALKRDKGEQIWSYATRNRVDSSPVIVGKRVIVASLDGNLYVLDLEKGTELQKLRLGDSISASPAVAENRVVIGTTDGVVYCLGAKK